MASPPFNINQALPGDSDIVSQHPANARQFRDVVESWLLVNHDNNGNHATVTMPYAALPATPAASLIKVFTDSRGRLKMLFPDGSVQFVGNNPGAVLFTAKPVGVPVGYLVADGSAVSRATFADLFDEIGTFFGPGDGSTTFNLPDIKGRVIASEDASSGRLTDAIAGIDIFGDAGGSQSQTLTLAQLPTGINSANTGSIILNVTQTDFSVRSPSNNPSSATGVGTQRSQDAGLGAFVGQIVSTGAITAGNAAVTSNNTGGAAHPNVQPTIVLRAMIKW